MTKEEYLQRLSICEFLSVNPKTYFQFRQQDRFTVIDETHPWYGETVRILLVWRTDEGHYWFDHLTDKSRVLAWEQVMPDDLTHFYLAQEEDELKAMYAAKRN